MMSTYCGKNCEECTYKTELSCSGCLSGPGRVVIGDCKLAHCCRDKGHETCETCALKRNCGTWLDKGSIPKQRIERRIELQKEQEMIARRAPFLGKWLWILFWLVVPAEISGIKWRACLGLSCCLRRNCLNVGKNSGNGRFIL